MKLQKITLEDLHAEIATIVNDVYESNDIQRDDDGEPDRAQWIEQAENKAEYHEWVTGFVNYDVSEINELLDVDITDSGWMAGFLMDCVDEAIDQYHARG